MKRSEPDGVEQPQVKRERTEGARDPRSIPVPAFHPLYLDALRLIDESFELKRQETNPSATQVR